MQKKLWLFTLLFASFYGKGQKIGIGTTSPHSTALLHVNMTATPTLGFLVSSPELSGIGGTVPNLGGGCRLMFYPRKAAFRVGVVAGNNWDNINVGSSSTGIGSNTLASGYNATAIGYYAQATGDYSTSLGFNTKATNQYSFASGLNTTANGWASTPWAAMFQQVGSKVHLHSAIILPPP